MTSLTYSQVSYSKRFFQQAFLLNLFWLAPVFSALGQQPSPTPDLPRAKVAQVKKLSDGGFLIAVRLYASKSKPLSLYRQSSYRSGQRSGEDPLPFSLAGSKIKDLISGIEYPALPVIPTDPYFGPIDASTVLQPNGWMQLGVAFPPIPPPPLGKDGKKQPYQLLFSVPELKIESSILLDPESFQPIAKKM